MFFESDISDCIQCFQGDVTTVTLVSVCQLLPFAVFTLTVRLEKVYRQQGKFLHLENLLLT